MFNNYQIPLLVDTVQQRLSGTSVAAGDTKSSESGKVGAKVTLTHWRRATTSNSTGKENNGAKTKDQQLEKVFLKAKAFHKLKTENNHLRRGCKVTPYLCVLGIARKPFVLM